ncbi:MAG: PatB family C-S lyase [Anaerolineae bacterium]
MPTNFDENIERLGSGAIKWDLYDPDVLPAWVADMDFRSPEPILKALRERVEHGVFGYHFDDPKLRDLLTRRMANKFGWRVKPSDFQFTPNLVSVLNFVSEAFTDPGDNVIMSTPVYMPFLSAPGNSGRVANMVDLAVTRDGQKMRYEMDFDAFEAAINPRTKVFLLCNPHNPVGRLWSKAELEKLAEICLRHNIIIAADEIHCDLMMEGQQHIPFASLSPEVAERTITLMSPSKTYNMPTLGIAYVVAQNETIYKTFEKSIEGFMPHVGSMGWAAAYAAYAECQPWVDELLTYLRANRDFMVDYMQKHLPQVPYTVPEATYLGWMDWRALNLPGESPFKFFLEKARVAFVDGAAFGEAGKGFTRINYATQRERLHEILERVRRVVEDL